MFAGLPVLYGVNEGSASQCWNSRHTDQESKLSNFSVYIVYTVLH